MIFKLSRRSHAVGAGFVRNVRNVGRSYDFGTSEVPRFHAKSRTNRAASVFGIAWRTQRARAALLAFTFCFSYTPCRAAVRAQHNRRLPKGEPCVPDSNALVLYCLPPRLAFRIRLQIPSSKAFHPHPFVPSPRTARTAALRPQFALEASKYDFSAFQQSSHFLLPFSSQIAENH